MSWRSSKRRRRARPQTGELVLSRTEQARVAALLAPELRVGWIPTEHDLRAAAGAVRRLVDAPGPAESP